jgi:hypothetical protein
MVNIFCLCVTGSWITFYYRCLYFTNQVDVSGSVNCYLNCTDLWQKCLQFGPAIRPTTLALAILGETTQMGMILFVSSHPRWPITGRVGMKLWIFSPKQLCQCKWANKRHQVWNGKTLRFKSIDILTTKTSLFRKKREWETNWRLGLNVIKLFFFVKNTIS